MKEDMQEIVIGVREDEVYDRGIWRIHCDDT